jgi:hypothetical protein
MTIDSEMLVGMKNHYYPLLLLALIITACQTTGVPQTPLPSLEPLPKPLLTMTKKSSISTSVITTTVTPKPPRATTESPKLPGTSQPIIASPSIVGPFISNKPGEIYDTVFSIPVGQGRIIQYRGGNNPDMEITGPNAIAILPDDTFMLADLIGNRLLHFNRSGDLLNAIELYDLGIVNVADMRIKGGEIFLLEISLDFSPPRYRVDRLSFDGALIAYYDIPSGFHIENGLTGIAINCEGDIILELEGGGFLYRLADVQNNPKPADLPNGFYCNGKWYKVDNPGPQSYPNIIAGEVEYGTQLTTGFGGLRVIDAFQDGSLYIQREDLVNDKIINVDQTVHFVGSDLATQGVARVPISEYYYPIRRNLAINTKGEVYALLPLRNSLDVIHLNFYKNISPLLSGAIMPQIIISYSKNPLIPNTH